MQHRRADDVDAWVVAREELHVKVAELVVLVRLLAPSAEQALDGAAARKEERARGVVSRAVGSHERRAEQVLAHGAVVVMLVIGVSMLSSEEQWMMGCEQ